MPVSSLVYKLFEDKTWFEQVEELTQENTLKEVIEAEIERLKSEIEVIDNEIKERMATLYFLATGKNISPEDVNDEIQKEIEENWDKIRNNLEVQIISQEIIQLLQERQMREKEIIKLRKQQRNVGRYSSSFKILYDYLRMYPKYIRLGVFNELEVEITRAWMDTYNLLVYDGIVNNDPTPITFANQVIAPNIITLVETSLARNGIFLQMILGSPILQEETPVIVPPEKEEVVEEEKEKREVKSFVERFIPFGKKENRKPKLE